MNVSSEKSVSLWMGTRVLDDTPVLNKAEKADVVIVGSGIAGMFWKALKSDMTMMLGRCRRWACKANDGSSRG
jgi:hypothetical protein